MKTICIKTNNENAIEYLLKMLKNYNLEDVRFSCKKFKVFKNIFIHYKGSNLKIFLFNISEILSFLVLELYEKDIVNRILSTKKKKKCEILLKYNNLNYEDRETISCKMEKLTKIFFNLLEQNNKLYLKGTITFRLSEYIKNLQSQIDSTVNQYLIEKEYNEFVSLLKIYINNEPCKTDLVHLIYNNNSIVLLDKNKTIIKTDSNILNAKYLSDITFSDSDIVLNTLLNLIPKKIYLHLVNKQVDEFITTLKLIFENRIVLCTD